MTTGLLLFNRTECACSECVACCKRQPGPLADGDFERIAEFLGETHEQARKHFMASRGAAVHVRDVTDPTGQRYFQHRIPTITPKRAANGACVFLDEHDRCRVHPVSPAGCAYFDVHMDMPEAGRRSLAMAITQCSDAYQKLRSSL